MRLVNGSGTVSFPLIYKLVTYTRHTHVPYLQQMSSLLYVYVYMYMFSLFASERNFIDERYRCRIYFSLFNQLNNHENFFSSSIIQSNSNLIIISQEFDIKFK